MKTYCPCCYQAKVYCRKCKASHCGCSWARCKQEKKTTRPTARRLEQMRQDDLDRSVCSGDDDE
jgi:hypothetical protein